MVTCICLNRNFPEFGCPICKKVLVQPLTTPCGHNFCKECLLGTYADKSFMRERTREGGRTLRAQKIVKKCPSCPTDIAEYLQNPQVNREMNNLIETLKKKSEEEAASAQQNKETEDADEAGGTDDGADADEDEGFAGAADEVEDVDNDADANEAEVVDNVTNADEDKAELTVIDESEPSDDAVENGNAVNAEKVEYGKVASSRKGNSRAGACANGKAASTEEVQAEKLNASGKRKGMDGAGGHRGSKKVKTDV